MFGRKKASESQKYENYWKLTVEYSDIYGAPFYNTLRVIVDFIDSHPSLKEKYDKKLYQSLQEEINRIYPKSDQASTRKSINQFIKLGFIFPKLRGYRPETLRFIRAKDNEEKALVFSEVYYKYANFNSSVTRDNSQWKQINFLLKTLMNQPSQSLNKDEIIGLMTVDLLQYNRGYLLEEELLSVTELSKVINFEDRKYNQINYFMNFLQYIPGIKVSSDKSIISYVEDEFYLESHDINLERDPTLFRIMKEKVKKESRDLYGDVVCYITKQPQKGLIVSHIVPSQQALSKGDIDTAYNPNNSLLLEPNIDAYFDKHNITFLHDIGVPLFDDSVYDNLKNYLSNKKLDSCVLNNERQEYLKRHNEYFFEIQKNLKTEKK